MSAAENQAVFLSYASQNAEAAKRLCEALPPSPGRGEALRQAGVEVRFHLGGMKPGLLAK